MIDLVLFQKFLIALAIGALIGLEREYTRYRKRTSDYAGIRTFPLIAVFGALSAYLGKLVSPWLLIVGILLVGLLIVAAYFAINKKSGRYVGATSEIAGLLTFFIGVLCYYDETLFAVILGISITLILYARTLLHHFTEKLKEKELADTLKFAVVAFIILPLLPNQAYGPLELFNPYLIWLIVVFISGISFIGYILLKYIGEKGIPLTGLLGGLVSSTVVTSNFSEKSRRELNLTKALVLGVILANGVMFVRLLIEVSILNPALIMRILPSFALLMAATGVYSFFLWRNAKKVQSRIELGSPFTLIPAVKFALIFAAVSAVVKVAHYYLPSSGVYFVSFVSGLADADAITVSLAQLAKTKLAEEVASKGIILAVLANICTKGGIALFFGNKIFSRSVALFFGFLILLGIGLLIFL